MLLILPISEHDHHLLADLFPLMLMFGPYEAHHLALIYGENITDERKKEIRAATAGMMFKSTRSITPRLSVEDRGWPRGPNAMFREACWLAGNLAMDAPWYFFEPDNTPMKTGWLDTLEGIWHRDESRPFLGAIEPTRASLGNGEFMDIGSHLVGTAIYPSDIDRYCATFESDSDEPFDIRLGESIVGQELARSTRRIQHNWSTVEYHRDADGVIRCKRAAKRSNMPGAPIVKEVNPDALVVHGCKDGSLARLLANEILGGVVQSLFTLHLERKSIGAKDSAIVAASSTEPVFEP